MGISFSVMTILDVTWCLYFQDLVWQCLQCFKKETKVSLFSYCFIVGEKTLSITKCSDSFLLKCLVDSKTIIHVK